MGHALFFLGVLEAQLAPLGPIPSGRPWCAIAPGKGCIAYLAASHRVAPLVDRDVCAVPLGYLGVSSRDGR